MNVGASHRFKVATLPAIVLLKLIAFDDRPENRMKDARDIANIILHYFDLQADFIYANHSDIFDRDTRALDDITLQEISGIVIGREIRRIADRNMQLQIRLTTILKLQLDLAENSAFIRNMVEETEMTLEEVAKWVSAILRGLS